MSWLQVPFDSLLIHFWYICVLTKREVQMAGYWQSSFSFFFFFFAFLWTVTSQSSEKRKKRNDANIQLSWPNEQYEFDIIRIKMTCLFWGTGKKSKCRERFLFVLPRAWDREKILSPHEEPNLRDSDTALRCSNHWATETPRWARGLLRSSYDTRPTYC